MTLKRYTLAVTSPEHWDDIHSALTLDSNRDGIPDRKITCVDEKSHSATRGTYELTEEEAAEIARHPYVKWIELSLKDNRDNFPRPQLVQPQRWDSDVKIYRDLNSPNNPPASSPTSAEENRTNWAVPRISGIGSNGDFWPNVTGSIAPKTGNVNYLYDGRNVDIVIHDSGVLQSHPEFLNDDGTSRVRDIVLDFPYFLDPGWFQTNGFTFTLEDQQIKPGTLGITDFRNNVNDPNSVARSNYRDNNIATRITIGNPGARPANQRTNINSVFASGQDQINLSDIEPRNDNNGTSGFPKDLIKFAFETINNDDTSTTTATFFRAFLTGYNDNHNAEWAASRYTGRGENFYTYQGFDRTVNFNFKIAAQSKQEMRFLYRKLNYLLSTLYPDYNSAGFMRGNITKLTIGDLFVRTPGILESLQLNVDDQYAWEIAMGDESKDMLETPQLMDVAVQFKPILNVLPKTGIDSPILITDPKSKYLNNRDNSGTLAGVAQASLELFN